MPVVLPESAVCDASDGHPTVLAHTAGLIGHDRRGGGLDWDGVSMLWEQVLEGDLGLREAGEDFVLTEPPGPADGKARAVELLFEQFGAGRVAMQ